MVAFQGRVAVHKRHLPFFARSTGHSEMPVVGRNLCTRSRSCDC
ncbi:unnamed protein product [Staurois parvus]|uniref:Uncharacterized protein n=1 Tax=Staurois parvus TaxID=386267 RepID=A0ABN9C999_9NEOB|nr:unnamed protein product [Staurois parvus]